MRLRLAATLIRLLDFERAWKFLGEAERATRSTGACRGIAASGSWREDSRPRPLPLSTQVFSELPGEPAPKLALALASESAGDSDNAERLYDLISRTDPAFVTASLGLGRCLDRAGRRAEAVAALRRVPQTSSLYIRAQLMAARCLTRSASARASASSPQAGSTSATPGPGQAAAPPSVDELCQASELIEALPLEGAERAQARADVLSSTLNALVSRGVGSARNRQVLGCALVETDIRRGLEQALRQMARFESNRHEQIALVDRANSVRPRTWM